jgi:hypothetical protein
MLNVHPVQKSESWAAENRLRAAIRKQGDIIVEEVGASVEYELRPLLRPDSPAAYQHESLH